MPDVNNELFSVRGYVSNTVYPKLCGTFIWHDISAEELALALRTETRHRGAVIITALSQTRSQREIGPQQHHMYRLGLVNIVPTSNMLTERQLHLGMTATGIIHRIAQALEYGATVAIRQCQFMEELDTDTGLDDEIERSAQHG